MNTKVTALDKIEAPRRHVRQVGRDPDREVPAKKARENFSRMLDLARNENDRFVITDHDTPAAAVVPLRDLDVLDWLGRIGLTDTTSELSYSNATLEQFRAKLNEAMRRDAGGTGLERGRIRKP